VAVDWQPRRHGALLPKGGALALGEVFRCIRISSAQVIPIIHVEGQGHKLSPKPGGIFWANEPFLRQLVLPRSLIPAKGKSKMVPMPGICTAILTL